MHASRSDDLVENDNTDWAKTENNVSQNQSPGSTTET